MRTNLHLVLCLTCLLSSGLTAQDLRQRMDIGTGGICRDMVRLPGGSTLVVGELSGTPIPVGWVSLLSETGDILWTKVPFDQMLATQFLRVKPDTDSTFLIGGTKYIDPVKGTDLLVMRLTNKGEILWSRTIDFNLVDGFSDLDLFDKGAVLIGTTLDDATGMDVVIAVLDQDGSPGISRQFGAAGLESATGIRYAGPHGFYISGNTTSYTFPGEPPSAFLMQISPTFSFSWMRLIGDADEQRVPAMALGTKGYPMIAIHDDGGLGTNYICQFNHTGGLEWSRSYNTETLRAITRSPGGKIFAADDHTVFGLDDDGQVVSAWLLQPDASFTTSCLQIGEKGQYLLGGWYDDIQDFPAMHVIPDPFTSSCNVGTVITVAQDHEVKILNELINTFDSGQVAGGKLDLVDITVNRIIDCQSTSSTDPLAHDIQLTVYPNPTVGTVRIDLPAGLPGMLTWYRADGTLIEQQCVDPSSGPVTAQMDNWPTGTYVLEFRRGDLSIVRKILRVDQGN